MKSKDTFFCSDTLDYHGDELDDFEVDEHKRVLNTVKTKDKRIVEAYIYILRESLSVVFHQIAQKWHK